MLDFPSLKQRKCWIFRVKIRIWDSFTSEDGWLNMVWAVNTPEFNLSTWRVHQWQSMSVGLTKTKMSISWRNLRISQVVNWQKWELMLLHFASKHIDFNIHEEVNWGCDQPQMSISHYIISIYILSSLFSSYRVDKVLTSGWNWLIPSNTMLFLGRTWAIRSSWRPSFHKNRSD